MKSIKKCLSVVAVALLPLSAPTLAFEYSYGEIPVLIQLCSKVKSTAGLNIIQGINGHFSAEAGVGVNFIGDAEVQAFISGEVEMVGGLSSAATLSSSNCIDLVNTKAPTSNVNLSAQDQLLVDFLLSDDNGRRLDGSELALELIGHSLNYGKSLGASRFGVNTFAATTDTFATLIDGFDPVRITDSLEQLVGVLDDVEEFLPAELRDLDSPDVIILNHLQQLNFIESSCQDLFNGDIENLTQEMLEIIADVCLVTLEFQLELEEFIGGVIVGAEIGVEAAEQIAGIIASGQTAEAITDSIGNTTEEVEQTVQELDAFVSELGRTIDLTEAGITQTLAAGEQIITGSFDSISATTTQIGDSLADSASSSSGNIDILTQLNLLV